MRFIFVTDIHSSKPILISLKKLICSSKSDALIIGGDIFAYSPNAEPQLSFAKECFCEFLKDTGIPIYIATGNCDKPQTINYLKSLEVQGIINILTLTGTRINNIEFIGYNYVQPTLFKIKDWERRDLEKDSMVFEGPCFISDDKDKLKLVPNNFLNGLPSIEKDLSILNNKKSIWVIHAPPFGGVLDRTYGNISAGSKAVLKAIQRVQPILTLHGHIHESPYMSHRWSERIGNTISVNPGAGEVLQGVIVEVDEEGNIIYMSHTLYGDLSV